jgi:hypothetical protein
MRIKYAVPTFAVVIRSWVQILAQKLAVMIDILRYFPQFLETFWNNTLNYATSSYFHVSFEFILSCYPDIARHRELFTDGIVE